MIACIIEFTVKPGMEAENQAMLARLLPEVGRIDGFISKESYESRTRKGQLFTLSLWRDEEALRAWNRHPDHVAAMKAGKNEIFSSYRIIISEVIRDYRHDAPDGTA